MSETTATTARSSAPPGRLSRAGASEPIRSSITSVASTPLDEDADEDVVVIVGLPARFRPGKIGPPQAGRPAARNASATCLLLDVLRADEPVLVRGRHVVTGTAEPTGPGHDASQTAQSHHVSS